MRPRPARSRARSRPHTNGDSRAVSARYRRTALSAPDRAPRWRYDRTWLVPHDHRCNLLDSYKFGYSLSQPSRRLEFDAMNNNTHRHGAPLVMTVREELCLDYANTRY